jgi:hypothetical protein
VIGENREREKSDRVIRESNLVVANLGERVSSSRWGALGRESNERGNALASIGD